MAFNLSNSSSRLRGEQPALTDRQIEILRLIAEGLRNKEIADILDIRPKTVEFHKKQLYAKIGAASTADAVRFAFRNGYLNSGTQH